MNETMIGAEEFDRMFDEGDMRYLDYVDFSKTTRPGFEQEKVSISLPNGCFLLSTRKQSALA
jgi:hypothetical protein